jgi:hypothetical protein
MVREPAFSYRNGAIASGAGGVATFDPTFDWSLEGMGTCPYTFTTLPTFTGPTGTVIVETYGVTAKNDDFVHWKASGKIFPALT